MKPSLALAAFTLSLVSAAAQTQTAPATPPAPAAAPRPVAVDAAGKPIAADAILVADPATLTPGEIKRLQATVGDYGHLARYHDANATLPASEPGRVVFFGDSITDAWGRGKDPVPFFPGKPYVNRGISGETTPQMLVRFQQDVINLKPAAVLILAGTNDLAGNTGVESMETIRNEFTAMATLANANHIKVILASVLPVDDYAWRRGLQPADKVRAVNAWMKQFCAAHGYTYLDYYSALATPEGAMKPGTSRDGVHPTPAGYAIMAPLAQSAIDQTLKSR